MINFSIFQLDIALEEIETQRNGLVFIYNMSNSKYSNFDYDLSQKMLTLLKGKYFLFHWLIAKSINCQNFEISLILIGC